MRLMKISLALVLYLHVYSVQASHVETQHTGEVNGAKYIIDVPAEPSGDLLLIARGYRPDFFPLSAVYEVDTNFYQTLLSEGWVIASTSYQTNDWVVSDGGVDILALKNFVDGEITAVKRAVVYGETMGGGVAVWLAENEPEAFAGVFALGAHLYPEPRQGAEPVTELATVFNAAPKLPIIFVANVEEMQSSLTYVDAVGDGARFSPVIWAVDRPGHVNVNSAERLSAMRALLNWIEGNTISSKQNALVSMQPGSEAALSKGAAAGSISHIRPLYGNLYSNFVASDLAALGIEIGDVFELVHGQETYEVTYGEAYSDVPIGEWVAFVDPEGRVQLSRNYANAAETLGAAKGDALLLLPK
jgi:hypothetical protein